MNNARELHVLLNNLIDVEDEMRFLTYALYTQVDPLIKEAFGPEEAPTSSHPFATRLQLVHGRCCEIIDEIRAAIDGT